jgi:hypothetical protein
MRGVRNFFAREHQRFRSVVFGRNYECCIVRPQPGTFHGVCDVEERYPLFPELREKITEFDRVCAVHRAFFNEVHKKLLDAKIQAVQEAMAAGKAAGNWAGWQEDSDTRAAQAQMNVRDACSVELQVGDQAVFAVLSDLDEAAAALMAEIIAAPPSS